VSRIHINAIKAGITIDQHGSAILQFSIMIQLILSGNYIIVEN